jgi:Tfp pilus assembly protein PilN
MAGPSVADSNLLPNVYRPKPISLIRVVALPSAVTVVALLIPMVILAQSTSDNIASLHSQLDATNRLINQEQVKKNELKQKLTQTETSLKTFSTALNNLEDQGNAINGDFDEVVTSQPDKTRLALINHAIDPLTINGTVKDETEVLSYARNLEASKRFSEVIISNLKTTENGEMEFTLILKTKG